MRARYSKRDRLLIVGASLIQHQLYISVMNSVEICLELNKDKFYS